MPIRTREDDDRREDRDDDDRPRRQRPRFTCPFCSSHSPPITKQKVSTAGWVVTILLCITVCGILFCWIGLLLKEDYHVCSSCGMKIGG